MNSWDILRLGRNTKAMEKSIAFSETILFYLPLLVVL
jgi:hypothetical protein